MRRAPAEVRDIDPDPVYQSVLVSQLINKVLWRGKKGAARRIVYGSLDTIGERTGDDPLKTLQRAVENVKPTVEVRSRRVGGATYQVPIEVRADRSQALAIRWLIQNTRSRTEKTMMERLSAELLEAAGNRGGAVKKREDTHRMAEANRAVSHYRW